jgi:hypothetical protein
MLTCPNNLKLGGTAAAAAAGVASETTIRTSSASPISSSSVALPSPGGAITKKRDYSSIVTCPLDNCQFSASMLSNPEKKYKLLQALRTKKQVIIIMKACMYY